MSWPSVLPWTFVNTFTSALKGAPDMYSASVLAGASLITATSVLSDVWETIPPNVRPLVLCNR